MKFCEKPHSFFECFPKINSAIFSCRFDVQVLDKEEDEKDAIIPSGGEKLLKQGNAQREGWINVL